MSEKETGGQAFPTPGLSQLPNGDVIWPEAGAVTLRDYFAAHCPLPLYDGRSWEEEALARYAYADAMIAERSK